MLSKTNLAICFIPKKKYSIEIDFGSHSVALKVIGV